MPKIKRLSPQEAQKIAAGEVVERPANVVKELIENALDAAATHISIYIKDGGKKLIRIVDNGHGMTPEDALLCFEHHATSKIRSIEDLASLRTFGFRGEALSSIASVSHVTLITKTAHSLHGTRVESSGNRLHIVTDTPAKEGTDITISNLFFNLPARAKFLKKKETEWHHIQQLFHVFCISYPQVHFELHHEGKLIHNISPASTLQERISQIWDAQLMRHMIFLPETERKLIHISGAISNHQLYRYDRSLVYFFVNNRWVKNYQLSNAVLKGYQHVIPAGKYPALCLFITVDPHTIDINAHPRKEEVLFLEQQTVFATLRDTIKSTLEHHVSKQLNKQITFKSAYIPDDFPKQLIHPHAIDQNSFNTPPIFNKQYIQPTSLKIIDSLSALPDYTESIVKSDKASTHSEILNQKENEPKITASSIQQTSYTPEYISPVIIGVYKKTYIMLEHEGGILFVDQHAAHERVLYELFSQRPQEHSIVSLMFPITITLSSTQIDLLKPYFALLKENGIDIEVFSNDQLIIHGTSIHLKNSNIHAILKEMINWIIEYEYLPLEEVQKKFNDMLHIQIACSAAVKAGDILENNQIQALLKDLHHTNNRFCCPHGRPTSWLLLHDDLKKKFKRDYRK